MNSQLSQALQVPATADPLRSQNRMPMDRSSAENRSQDDSSTKVNLQEKNKSGTDAKLTSEDLRELSENANKALDAAGTSLSFFVDEKVGTTVISIVDKQTGETVREIPSEQMRELAARMAESLEAEEEPVGLLLEKQA